MELINTKESYCMYCLLEPRKVIHLKIVDNEIALCDECLLKAYLLINPIQFDKEFIIDWLYSQKNRRDDMDKFIEFVRSFLIESK